MPTVQNNKQYSRQYNPQGTRRRVSRKKRRRQRMIAKCCIYAVMLLILIGILYGGYRLILSSRVYKECAVEAGGTVSAGDFLKKKDPDAFFADDSEEIDTTIPGVYHVKVTTKGHTYRCKLKVNDTIAPTAEAVSKQIKWGDTCTAQDLVTNIIDATHVSVNFKKEPDFNVSSTQNVTIILVDMGKNKTELESTLVILPPDTEPPVISGAKDLEFTIGDTAAYRKDIVVVDNCDENVELVVDSSAVNLDEEGEYPLTYTATDASGNTATVTVKVFISPESYSVSEVYAYADQVLAQIITDGMTDYDKLWAIFTYIRNNVGYVNHSEKLNWVQAATEAFTKKQGDCYVYACVSKVLLTRAGITNMDIEKIPAKTKHYWNLVDIGDGWYHFDTTPRVDHPTIFYWDDETLMAYSNEHKLSHNYDHDAYPKVN